MIHSPHQRPQVALRVIAQGGDEFRGHQFGVAGEHDGQQQVRVQARRG
jgi:hypothetical protein